MPSEKKMHQKKQRTHADHPVCRLCGNTKNLTKTECCGNWICDDEQNYVPPRYFLWVA